MEIVNQLLIDYQEAKREHDGKFSEFSDKFNDYWAAEWTASGEPSSESFSSKTISDELLNAKEELGELGRTVEEKRQAFLEAARVSLVVGDLLKRVSGKPRQPC